MDTVWATITAIVDRHARIAPTPSELAARIPEMLADIRAKHPIHDTETTLLFLAAVFGPRELGRPPEETLVELRLLAATGGSLAEAVVVYGCRLPLSAIGWALRWERSVHALALMLETIVTGSTRWIHANIGERERGITVREDVRTIARFLAEVLASDHCSLCAAKWDDLRLESLERALSHCVEHHSLSTWQPGTSLEKFLYFSSEHSRSRQSLASRINDFRKGMHAKIAASGRLTAGYVMRCDCGSEYLANNRCQGCDSTGGVEEPRSWWLWIEHDRRRTGARNCNVCRRYFHYTPGATCPVSGFAS